MVFPPIRARNVSPVLRRILLVGCSICARAAISLRQGNTTAQVPATVGPAAQVPPVGAVGAAAQVPATFQSLYNSWTIDRGIWKWSNALESYQRHFGMWAGHQINFAEVGVQSGGSVLMWQSVLGTQCHVYGLDINQAVNKFADAKTTITIGDQGDVNMWRGFFQTTATQPLDALVDDGGHESHQMLTTLYEVWPHLRGGGFIAIEDIHGQAYIDTFFTPAANFLAGEATKGLLASVHLYPFLFMAQRVENPADAVPGRPPSQLVFAGLPTIVSDFNQLAAALPNSAGSHIILENAGWGPFHTAAGLTNFFKAYAPLHDYDMYDVPTGCATTPAAVCSAIIRNNPMQAQITGIHVYPTRLVVEVAAQAPTIQAVRKGTTFLNYGF